MKLKREFDFRFESMLGELCTLVRGRSQRSAEMPRYERSFRTRGHQQGALVLPGG